MRSWVGGGTWGGGGRVRPDSHYLFLTVTPLRDRLAVFFFSFFCDCVVRLQNSSFSKHFPLLLSHSPAFFSFSQSSPGKPRSAKLASAFLLSRRAIAAAAGEGEGSAAALAHLLSFSSPSFLPLRLLVCSSCEPQPPSLSPLVRRRKYTIRGDVLSAFGEEKISAKTRREWCFRREREKEEGRRRRR